MALRYGWMNRTSFDTVKDRTGFSIPSYTPCNRMNTGFESYAEL
jgi:hypothetical protein